MPDSKVDTKAMTPRQKAKYLLELPCNVPSNRDSLLWAKCYKLAEMRAKIQRIADEHIQAQEQAERDALENALKTMPAADDHDISRYVTGSGFDAMRFITDKKCYKTTWDGHILSAEDIMTVRTELAKGTPKAEIHDIIRHDQRERSRQYAEKQARAINAQFGMINQPFCKACMNRGFFAVVENDLYITFRICGCTLRREKAAEERRKAELEEKKNKKRGGKNNGTV